MIPRYVRGGCTDAEKSFLENHCQECMECSVKLVHEKNRQEESREAGPDPGTGRDQTFPGKGERRAAGRRSLAAVLVLAGVITVCIAVGAIFTAFLILDREEGGPFNSGEYSEDFDESSLDDMSGQKGPQDLPGGEDRVIDLKDPVLEKRVREEIWIGDREIMYSDIVSVTRLDLTGDKESSDERISDISALAEFENLTELYLGENEIEDISPLRGMKQLKSLGLSGNRISDLGPLEDLEDLEYLNLNDNLISDIGPLKRLVNLKNLLLSGNRITDISPLNDMDALTHLNLSDNEIRDIDVLEKLTELEEVNIRNNPVEDDSVLYDLDANVTY